MVEEGKPLTKQELADTIEVLKLERPQIAQYASDILATVQQFEDLLAFGDEVVEKMRGKYIDVYSQWNASLHRQNNLMRDALQRISTMYTGHESSALEMEQLAATTLAQVTFYPPESPKQEGDR